MPVLETFEFIGGNLCEIIGQIYIVGLIVKEKNKTLYC